MDWNLAIERNREALKRILAGLIAMAGFAGLASPLAAEDGSAGLGGAEATAEPGEGYLSGGRPTLPRHLHRAVLRLLRPAEAAARRLVIVAARELVMPRRIVSGPPPLTPPHKGEGKLPHTRFPSPLRGSEGRARQAARPGKVRGEGNVSSPRPLSLPLFDPLRRPRRPHRPLASGIPRISVPGFSKPFAVPVRRAPASEDTIDASRLALRLAALGRALDDLPGHARRFARWQAARGRLDPPLRSGGGGPPKAVEGARIRRLSPLRLGRPPGQRPTRCRRPAHEVHEVLADMQWFARQALEHPDTS